MDARAVQPPCPPPSCPACTRLQRAKPGDDPFYLAVFRESIAILHKHQRYPGWCTLWLKDHHEHLALLPRERQERLQLDVLDLAAAMHTAFDGPGDPSRGIPPGPIRINYECLGNVVAHVHWHLIPRRATDPDPHATVWVRPVAETDRGCDDSMRDRLMEMLKAACPR
ncbi:MAG: HIT family protein [Phycisphaerales bacterium]